MQYGDAKPWQCLGSTSGCYDGINGCLIKANATDSDPVKVAANTEVVIAASAFGAPDFGTHRFLTAVNQSATETTKYEVEVL